MCIFHRWAHLYTWLYTKLKKNPVVSSQLETVAEAMEWTQCSVGQGDFSESHSLLVSSYSDKSDDL